MDSSADPKGPAEGGAAAPSEAGAAAQGETLPREPAPEDGSQGEELRITGFVEVDLGAETGSEPAATELDVAPPPAPDRDVEVAPAPLAPAAPRAVWHPSSWLLVGLSVAVAVLDIGSKEWAKRALAGPDLKRTAKHIEVIPNHLDFIFAQNPGGAWSFLRGVPDGLRRPFFLFVSAAAIVFIVMVYWRLDRRQWAMRWGLPLALGGAIGNLTDRIRYGWVVDFIDMYYKGKANEVHWPTFNVADIAIVIGVGLMAVDLLSIRKLKEPSPQPVSPEAAGGAA
jgi:signal peptidase II